MATRLPFHPPEVLLLGPGPSPASARTLAAQAAPLLGHLDPAFLGLMDQVQADLRVVMGTQNPFTMPISGTGSAGMETCLTNLVEAGDRVVIGTNGVFGGRMKDLAQRLGAEVVEVKSDFGQALDAEAMAKAVAAGPTKLLAFVHAETSTGVLQPPEEIINAAKQQGALVLMDCVTSLAGSHLALDEWGVDAAFSGTQKCLSVPPGLSPVSFSAAAMQRIQARQTKPPSWYLDVGMLANYWGSGERVYHHTAPISMVYALASGLEQVMEEGLEPRYARHQQAAQALYRGLQAMGISCLVAEDIRTPMLTSILVPEGVDEAAARAELRQRHRIEIGGGLGPLKGKVWRIGLMGHGARLQSVLRVLSGLGDVLARAGHKVDLTAALRQAAG